MGIPQIITVFLCAMGLGQGLVLHGQPVVRKHNFWTQLVATGIQMAILAWGGFFG